MAFGYEFVNLDDDQKHARRVLLELYPWIAQWSAVVVLLVFQVCFSVSWLARRSLDSERPRSPAFSKREAGILAWLRQGQQGFNKWLWWMKKPVIPNWGSRGEWIGGAIWFIWLLSLSIIQTGNDYLHLTKRFGIIGASQLPLHYLLAMRSPYSPIQFLTRMSHEQLKSAHQILGRIVLALFSLHGIFYMYFFIASGFLAKRIKDKDVILGLITITLFVAIGTTALSPVRKWNYRVFYVSHISIANLVIVPMYFHAAHHIFYYALEVAVINTLHLVLRYLAIKKRPGTIRLLPGTNLVQVRVPLSPGDSALKWRPGQHVYLSKPSRNATAPTFYDELVSRNQTNPFTVASIPAEDKELVLVARTLNGNTKQLAELARTLSSGADEAPSIPLTIEGPYGGSVRLPNFSGFDEILLVAGGVGATFIVPLYRHITSTKDATNVGTPHVHLIWSVRTLAETQWASSAFSPGDEDEEESNVRVFLTGSSGTGPQVAVSEEDIELAENEQLLSTDEQSTNAPKGMTISTGRPNLATTVNEVFSKGHRVAVFCCGPKALTEKLSQSVEQWVRKGHDVYWYDETFGW